MNERLISEAARIVNGQLEYDAPSVKQTRVASGKMPLSLWQLFVGTARTNGKTMRVALVEAVCLWLKTNRRN